MRDEPTGEQLLETARTLLRQEILPALPADKKHGALMIANAMSIAMRQLQGGETAERKEIDSLCVLLERKSAVAPETGSGGLRQQLIELNRAFSARIRAGDADSGDWGRAARAHLHTVIRTKVLESNPKYLEGEPG